MTPERWQQVERVYHAALERDAAGRAAFLAEVCRSDDALRREVESLLAQASGAAGFMSAPASARAGEILGDGGSLIGRTLGPYAIRARLGAGGMGEVYRARDSKLGRDVAIKILPKIFISDPDRLSRFEREARVLASLNHPHIGAIYGLESIDGTPALVLELVEGDTLADRIAKGPLPVTDAVAIAKQIAEALEAAHERGIVHRDLKPANIKITAAGVVKVLDFGLAKAAAGDASSPDLTHSPTITVGGTRDGVILGTAAYMSPEQARGQAVDKRTDIWAFGCVLYEMLTGRLAFAGATVSDTIAAVMMQEPEWSALPAGTPGALRRLLTRCLAKDATVRLRDIGEARIHIDDLRSGEREEAGPARRRPLAIWIAGSMFATACVAAAAMYAFVRLGQSPARTAAIRFAVPVPPTTAWLALSPDGQQLVYGDAEERGPLYVRSIDALEARRLAGTEGGRSPFWSPDGRAIGFFDDGKLKRIDLSGGALLVLADCGLCQGGTWSDDDVILFSNKQRALYRVGASGGTPTPVLTPERSTTVYRWPQFLPHSRRFLFFRFSYDTTIENAIYAGSLDTPQTTRVIGTEYQAAYIDPGYLLVLRNGNLLAQPVRADSLAPAGAPTVVAVQVQGAPSPNERNASFSASSTGALAYRVDSQANIARLAWLDRHGNQEAIVGTPDAYYAAELSPDGTRAALEILDAGGRGDIWMLDISRGTKQALTRTSEVWEYGPHWSPDGRYVSYGKTALGGAAVTGSIERRRADASGAEETVAEVSRGQKQVSHWSPDGRSILFWQPASGDARQGLFSVALADGHVRPIPETRPSETEARVSPDGRWLAYVSTESGRAEVYVRPLAGGSTVVVSGDGGAWPYWRRDGHELYYVAPDDTMQAVPVTATNPIKVGAPGLLFHLPPSAGGRSPYSTNDGEHFLVRRRDTETSSTVTWVVNWPALLKKP